MLDFSRPLLAWYKVNKRDLPWRRDATPYRVWVSEIMLQQTRIEAVRDYFERFTAAFPTVEALAAAEEDAVLKLWEGLGYYSRARNLHKCAKLVVSEYGGAFPRTAAELKRLPGIGDYTAGAIASIAFGEPESAVDGNVVRVLSRLENCADTADEKLRARYRAELKAISPPGECGAFTSALMELGETVCTPGTPACGRCPLAEVCAGCAAGRAGELPVLPAKRPRRIEERRVLLLICGGRTAVRRRPEKGLLAGLWELPNDTVPEPPAGGEPCGEAVHVFTHVEWRMRGYILRCDKELPGFTWVTGEERRPLAIPRAFRYYLGILEEMGL